MSAATDHGEIASAIGILRGRIWHETHLIARHECIRAALDAELATLIEAAELLAQHRARAARLFSETQP